jgi:hypothetical protein
VGGIIKSGTQWQALRTEKTKGKDQINVQLLKADEKLLTKMLGNIWNISKQYHLAGSYTFRESRHDGLQQLERNHAAICYQQSA